MHHRASRPPLLRRAAVLVAGAAGVLGLTGPALTGPALADTDPALADTGPSLAVLAPAPVPLTAPECPPVMAEGSFDGCVTELQHLLDAAAGADLLGTGFFGADTTAAVRGLQERAGLPDTGTVDDATKHLLYAAPVPDLVPLGSPECPDVVRPGEVDGCVTTLQLLLVGRGYPLTVTGTYDPATRASVAAHQAAAGLRVTGQVDAATEAALVSGTGPTAAAATGATTAPATGPIAAPATGPTAAAVTASVTDGDVAARVVAYARAVADGSTQTGWTGGRIPYSWGGGHGGRPGPSTGVCDSADRCEGNATLGLDCSGFARWVYALAYGRDVLGAGGSAQQIGLMEPVRDPRPGDLVFFGLDAQHVHHVGVYVGDGLMVDALRTGTLVRTDRVSLLPDLVGYYRLG